MPLYVLMRSIHGFDWENETIYTKMCASNDYDLLYNIADERNKTHENHALNYNYWVAGYEKPPIAIESEKDFYETYRKEIFDIWEE